MSEEEKFIEGLYDEANNQLKEVYGEQKQNRDKLFQEIALIMLRYSVLDGLMSIKRKDKDKEYKTLSKLIKDNMQANRVTQTHVINKILNNTVKSTFSFYSYNANLKDITKIVGDNFKGKHFSERVWENEKAVGEKLHKQVKQFLDGKINVNKIKKDIEKTFNINAYNAKRLVETEVARVENDSFKGFCNETGVKKVRRNAVLDNKTCNDCSSFDGKVYDLRDARDLPAHPLCRCFYEIVDNEIIHKISDNKETSDSVNVIVDKDTVNECAEKIKSLGVNSVDVIHIMNGEVLAPFVEELEKLKNEYGEMFNRIESIDLTENTIAQLTGSVLQLNQRYFNNNELLQKQLSDWLKVKYIPSGCDNINYVVTHEYMHLLTQYEIDNSTSIMNKICDVAKKEDIISINSKKDRYEFVADLLAANKVSGFKNRTVKKLLKIINGGR